MNILYKLLMLLLAVFDRGARIINNFIARRKCSMPLSSFVYDYRLISINDGSKENIKIGENTRVRGALICLPGGKIQVGDYCYIGENSKIWSDNNNILIQDRVLILHNVNIFNSSTHPLDAEERHRKYRKILESGFPTLDLGGAPVIIEDDVWIACNVVILPGVRIGKGAIIGAGAIVIKDSPPGVLAVGNPAKVVKELKN